MKKSLYNRRSFLTGTALAGAALAGPNLLLRWLEEPEAEARIFAILKQHLGLGEQDRALALAFATSLKTSSRHHLSAAALQRKLDTKQLAERENELALYVVQEFMVSSNYLAYQAGYEPTLALCPAPTETVNSPQKLRNSTERSIAVSSGLLS